MLFEEFDYVPTRFEIGICHHQNKVSLLKQYLTGIAFGPNYIRGKDVFFDFKKTEQGYVWCVQQGCNRSPLDHIVRLFEISPDAEEEVIFLPLVKDDSIRSVQVMHDFGFLEGEERENYSPIEFDRPMVKAQDEVMTQSYSILFFVLSLFLLAGAVYYRWVFIDQALPVAMPVTSHFQGAYERQFQASRSDRMLKKIIYREGGWRVVYEK